MKITLEEARAQVKRNHKPDHRQNARYEGITRSNARGTPEMPEPPKTSGGSVSADGASK